ncbi:hypothetical protein NFI96_001518, partial [Prochilodus magdalenae]
MWSTLTLLLALSCNISRQSMGNYARVFVVVGTLAAALYNSCCGRSLSSGQLSQLSVVPGLSSCVSFSDVFLCADSTCFGEAGKRKRRVCSQRQRPPQVDMTCVCARTRPLLTYHKPRLYTMGHSSLRQQ